MLPPKKVNALEPLGFAHASGPLLARPNHHEARGDDFWAHLALALDAAHHLGELTAPVCEWVNVEGAVVEVA